MLPAPKDINFRVKPDKVRFLKKEKTEDEWLESTGAWDSESRIDSAFASAENEEEFEDLMDDYEDLLEIVEALRESQAKADADFKESDHPRDEDGKFSTVNGAYTKVGNTVDLDPSVHSKTQGYYNYVHRRGSDGTIFYVGKGTKNRANSFKGRNGYWQNVVKKHGLKVETFLQGQTEEQAFENEINMVAHLMRENLANLTDGGAGFSGSDLTKLPPSKIKEILKEQKQKKQEKLRKQTAVYKRIKQKWMLESDAPVSLTQKQFKTIQENIYKFYAKKIEEFEVFSGIEGAENLSPNDMSEFWKDAYQGKIGEFRYLTNEEKKSYKKQENPINWPKESVYRKILDTSTGKIYEGTESDLRIRDGFDWHIVEAAIRNKGKDISQPPELPSLEESSNGNWAYWKSRYKEID